MPVSTLLGNLKAHSIELLLALWITIIFTERLIVDLATVKHFHRNQKDSENWRRLMRRALADRTVFAFVIPSFALLFLGLLLNHSRIVLLVALLRGVRDHVLGSIWDFLMLFLIIFLVALYRNPSAAKSIWRVAQDSCREVWANPQEPVILVGILIGVVMLSTILKLLAAGIGEDARTREIVEAWVTSNLFVSANTLLYFSVYWWNVGTRVARENKLWFWAGFAKDTSIYTLAAIFIANGTNRFRYALAFMAPRDMWMTLAGFAIPTLFLAIIAIAMDLWYVGAGSRHHSLDTEYPDEAPRDIMYFHIYLRFVGLFSVPLLLWFSYLAIQVAKAAQR